MCRLSGCCCVQCYPNWWKCGQSQFLLSLPLGPCDKNHLQPPSAVGMLHTSTVLASSPKSPTLHQPSCKIKCWHLTFLQTMDILKRVHFNDIMCCVINFHGGDITPWHDDRQARDTCLRWSFTGTLPAVFMSTKLDIFRNELGHSSWVCGDKNRYFKLKHDLFLTLTKWCA